MHRAHPSRQCINSPVTRLHSKPVAQLELTVRADPEFFAPLHYQHEKCYQPPKMGKKGFPHLRWGRGNVAQAECPAKPLHKNHMFRSQNIQSKRGVMFGDGDFKLNASDGLFYRQFHHPSTHRTVEMARRDTEINKSHRVYLIWTCRDQTYEAIVCEVGKCGVIPTTSAVEASLSTHSVPCTPACPGQYINTKSCRQELSKQGARKKNLSQQFLMTSLKIS